MRGEGRSFTPGSSVRAGLCRRLSSPLAQPRVRSERCPQATRRGATAFHAPTARRPLQAPCGERGWGLTWLAARSPRERWAHARRATRERGAGGEGKREGRTASKGSFVQGGRGSDARGACPRVVSLFAEVDRRRRTQRSARSPFHPIWGACRDGSLAHGRHASARAPRRAAGKGAPRAGSKRKPSRDRRSRSATVRAGARASPTDERHPGSARSASSSRRADRMVSAAPNALLVRKRSGGGWGGDKGARGSARSGARGRSTPRANPDGPPKRIGRRETPGPPVLWPWVQAQGQGRSASFEETPGNDEARVLVVEVVGSRSRLVRIGVELRGASQGKP